MSAIYTPTRYRYDCDEERMRQLPEYGFTFCGICGEETAEDELDEDGLCEECR